MSAYLSLKPSVTSNGDAIWRNVDFLDELLMVTQRRMLQQVVDLQDLEVREALIAAGWLPPDVGAVVL